MLKVISLKWLMTDKEWLPRYGNLLYCFKDFSFHNVQLMQ